MLGETIGRGRSVSGVLQAFLRWMPSELFEVVELFIGRYLLEVLEVLERIALAVSGGSPEREPPAAFDYYYLVRAFPGLGASVNGYVVAIVVVHN